ncbi:metal-dependent phosphohydrolase [Burkholderiaceae bacterium UC74_6]
MSHINLHGGGRFNFSDPRASEFTLEQIASSLAKQCRFTGHTRHPGKIYSVAQHAVMCSKIVPPEFALQALHHDDAEFVMGDCNSPLKSLLRDYKVMETIVHCEVFHRLGLDPSLHSSVKYADKVMLLTEQRDVGPEPVELEAHLVADGFQPLDCPALEPWSIEFARHEFLMRHHELGGTRSLYTPSSIEAVFAADEMGRAA